MKLGWNINFRLGGVEACSMAKGETLADTIRVVSGYAMQLSFNIRRRSTLAFLHNLLVFLVINAGDGFGQHPSQTLLNIYTNQTIDEIRDRMDLALIS